ncbi:carbohydrate ABC transporter permease [Clostridium amazonitimonense]|uniref:carbohydrate ABC transporter permease n=1 Tax=Clostridium amazonitimonense TaxID=1499689 RepID=UPI0009DF642C|nr:sugar ABC transporter permease [Clostridium amazonitimonense]
MQDSIDSINSKVAENITHKDLIYVKPKQKFLIEPYLYLIPCLLIFGVFVYFPFFKTLFLSFTLTNARGKFVEMVGFQNYVDIFKSPEFINSLKVTLKFVPMIAIPAIIVGFILALLANQKLKASRIYEIMFSMPMAVASAPAAIIWSMLFHPTIGFMNYILGTNIGWLTDERWALISVAIVTVWLNIGINFIFLTTGLKNISEELNESAAIDGANFFQRLFKITIPMVSPTLFFVILINVINAFQSFGQVKLMTAGGPGQATNVLVHSIYREAFFNNRFEMACTQSIILFLIMLTITLIQFKYERKGVHYQ